MTMDIFLIDGIAPFFRDYPKKQINWSKIPFSSLPDNPGEWRKRFSQIREDLAILATKAAADGYNAISLDDVAHLGLHDWLEPEINQMIRKYQKEYLNLFDICNQAGLNVFLTMDILSMTPQLKKQIRGKESFALQFIREQIAGLLTTFPKLKGIILRIGESDGKDVKGVFRSELLLQNAGQVNRLIRDLLPVFTEHKCYLVLRNWTVGAYRIGDLIWHRNTTARALKGIDSPWFILSMKYGESDFFRYLPLNKHFLRFKVKKIIELQAKREYEGAGEYPSFIGWDYYEYAKQLQQVENMVGISIWCQTGGWLPFRRLTYLEGAGIWNEINSFVALRLFRFSETVEEGIAAYGNKTGCSSIPKLIEFLRLSDQVVKELLYIEEVAGLKLFFRRVRIPPLLNVFWNNIFINHSVRKVLLAMVEDGEAAVQQGYDALAKIKRMRELAEELSLPVEDIDYMHATFTVLAIAREYYFLSYDKEMRKKIRQAKKEYKKLYPKGTRARYRIKTNFTPFFLRRRHLRWLMQLSLRKQRGYRVLDYLFTLHVLAAAYRVAVRVNPNIIPKFARKKAMGIDAIFR